MKTILSISLLLFVFHNFYSFSQVYESPRIAPNWLIEFNHNKIFTVSTVQDGNLREPTYFYDGQQWKDLNVDTMPTIHPFDSKAVISEFSNSIYLTGHYHLWEYSNGNWRKHAIYDSLYHLRRFEQMIELPDSSLLITAKTLFISGSSGNVVYVDATQNELLKFKNGEFKILHSSKSNQKPELGVFGSFFQLKKQRNGRYSYYTNIHSGSKQIFELVLFDSDGTIVEKYSIPTLDDRFKNAQVAFLDYLFDSKGSLFFLTTSQGELIKDSSGSFRDTLFFAGIVEVTPTKEIRYYNDNIGIQPSWYKSESFDIDDEDNIWFMYNYRIDFTKLTIYPSLYKLEANRTKIVEYNFETLLENSRIFNGEVPNFNYELNYEHKTIKYNTFRESVFITNGHPLIEFYPKGIPTTSVKELSSSNVFVYPNPVPNGKNVQIESASILGIDMEMKVVIQDLRGSLLKEYFYTIGSDNYALSINTEGLIRGSYVVSIFNKSNKLLLQTKFIKE